MLSLTISITHVAGAQEGPSPNPNPNHTMGEFCKKLPRSAYANLNQINDNDDWFQVYQIAPGVSAIYEPHQWQETISYLIEGQTKALLFDTGNGIGDIHALVKTLTKKPVTVLNSHSHFDHVGGNHAFKRIYAMDTPFSKGRQKGVANKDIAEEVSADALCRPLPNGVTEKNHTGKPSKSANTSMMALYSS